MRIEACAKVNLTLEVYGKRPDGYHELHSLVQPISLADTLDFEPADAFSTDTGYPDDLILKAAHALSAAVKSSDAMFAAVKSSDALSAAVKSSKPKAKDDVTPHLTRGTVLFNFQKYHIRVTKRIPVGGGLGGGSADAAATLRALNDLWQLGKTPEELAAIGAAVGSDVPALVLAQHYRCNVWMDGRGERVALARVPLADGHLVLANAGISVSTAEVYRRCVARTEPATGWVNDLEAPAVAAFPRIADTLAALRDAGAKNVMMSGSGATCFGFAATEAEAVHLVACLRTKGLSAWICRLMLLVK